MQIGGVGGDPLIGDGDALTMGELSYTWFDPAGFDGEDLADGTTILTLTMKALVSSGTATVSITDNPAVKEVVSANFCSNTVTSVNGSLSFTPITVTCPPNLTVCAGDPDFILTDGSPNDIAVHSGTGVSGTGPYTFSPVGAGPGTHVITYTGTDANGCSNTCNYQIEVELVQLTLTSVAPISVTCGDQIQIPIQVSNSFTDISSLQFSVEWDETKLQYLGNTALQIGGVGGDPLIGDGDALTMGELSYTWFDPAGFDGEDLADGTTILTLTMKVLGSSGTATVSITDNPAVKEVVSANFCSNTVTSVNGSMSLNPITITLDPIAAICPGVTTALLPYTATTGNPIEYKIDFDAAAEAAGFVDVAYTALPASPISIAVPANATCGTYNATLMIRNMMGCMNTYNIVVTVEDNVMPTITTCPVTRDIEGCNTGAITGPAYSTISAASSEAEFENATNQGVASDACGITEVTYIDVAVGACPTVVTRTWTVKDACGNIKTCDQTINVDDTTMPTITACPVTRDIEGCNTGAHGPGVFDHLGGFLGAEFGCDHQGVASDPAGSGSDVYRCGGWHCPTVVTGPGRLKTPAEISKPASRRSTWTTIQCPNHDLSGDAQHEGCNTGAITGPAYSTTSAALGSGI
ncbi:MAG: hypothetical protein IPM81_20370 [Saprospirales bacterium]|nr:hypothetical protein [Saprospirales bacterium]